MFSIIDLKRDQQSFELRSKTRSKPDRISFELRSKMRSVLRASASRMSEPSLPILTAAAHLGAQARGIVGLRLPRTPRGAPGKCAACTGPLTHFGISLTDFDLTTRDRSWRSVHSAEVDPAEVSKPLPAISPKHGHKSTQPPVMVEENSARLARAARRCGAAPITTPTLYIPCVRQ